jgi:hypothetical protein
MRKKVALRNTCELRVKSPVRDDNLVAADANPPKNDKIFVESRRNVTFLMPSLRNSMSMLIILRQINICRYQIAVLKGLSTLNSHNILKTRNRLIK